MQDPVRTIIQNINVNTMSSSSVRDFEMTFGDLTVFSSLFAFFSHNYVLLHSALLLLLVLDPLLFLLLLQPPPLPLTRVTMIRQLSESRLLLDWLKLRSRAHQSLKRSERLVVGNRTGIRALCELPQLHRKERKSIWKSQCLAKQAARISEHGIHLI